MQVVVPLLSAYGGEPRNLSCRRSGRGHLGAVISVCRSELSFARCVHTGWHHFVGNNIWNLETYWHILSECY